MKAWKTLITVLMLLSAAWTLRPEPASAQDAVLYEVTENTKFKDGKVLRRIAVAALQGTVQPGTPLCPSPAVLPCDITVFATDNIDTTTLIGPVRGSFAIVVNEPDTVDAAEVVAYEGSLKGIIDLSMSPLGLGSMTGEWKGKGLGAGTFTGTFRLPFALGPPNVFGYMLDPATFPAPGSFGVVQANEHALGFPTVKLEILFD